MTQHLRDLAILAAAGLMVAWQCIRERDTAREWAEDVESIFGWARP